MVLVEASGEVKGQTMLGKRPAEKVGDADAESSEEELTFASQTGTPTAARDRSLHLPLTDKIMKGRSCRCSKARGVSFRQRNR